MDKETLEQAGRLLIGEDWKLPMASVLGPHHPEGARERLDPRLVRRWAVGDRPGGRPIPPWVGPVLAALLEERAKELAWNAKLALNLSKRLKNGGGHGTP